MVSMLIADAASAVACSPPIFVDIALMPLLTLFDRRHHFTPPGLPAEAARHAFTR